MKAEDTLIVYADNKDGRALASFKAKSYSYRGMDYYEYNKVMYPAFVKDDGTFYILLSEPLFKFKPGVSNEKLN